MVLGFNFLRHFELSFRIEDVLLLLVLYFKGLELNVLLLGPIEEVNYYAQKEHENTADRN